MTSPRANWAECTYCGAGSPSGVKLCPRCRRPLGARRRWMIWARPGQPSLTSPTAHEEGQSCRADSFMIKAIVSGAGIAAILLVPPSVLLCVYSVNPGLPTPLGWCAQAVLAGLALGTASGFLFGGIVGVVVGVIHWISDEIRKFPPSPKARSGVWDRELDA